MPLLGFLARHRTFFDDDIDRPELVFAVGNATKSKYHPGCVVGDVDKRTGTVPVYFFHNEQERDVCVNDVIYHHGNLMMLKASFCRRGKVYTGTVYGNDSPKYDGAAQDILRQGVQEGGRVGAGQECLLDQVPSAKAVTQQAQ
jgi:hypothetical protein